MTRELSFCESLRSRAQQHPEQIAYIYLNGSEGEERPITYGELDRQARAIATEIRRICRPGERAILLYPPGLEFLSAFYGCLYAGVIAVPAYPPRSNRNLSRLQAIANDCQATLALTTEQIASSLRGSVLENAELDRLQIVASDLVDPQLGAAWRDAPAGGQAVAFLQYTSGSTGIPKGVMVSHRNLIHNSECIRERWDHSPSSIGVSWLPQFHDLGLIIGILQVVHVGYKAVLFSPASFIQKPFRWLDAVSRYRGTTTCAPNFAFDLCVAKIAPEQRQTLDLSCLETVMNGAEPVLRETLEAFVHAFGPCGFKRSAFRGGYGLAEGTVFVTTSCRAEDGPRVTTLYRSALEQHRVAYAEGPSEDTQDVVSCGPTAGDQELVIVDPNTKTRCRPDQIGEIWVKGASVAEGYWQRPEETVATFHARLEDTKEGSFLRTGDLGFLRNDEIYITGRSKDLLIVRGRNHYPQDIEKTVEKIHPCLRLNCSAAFSVREQNEERVVVVQEIRRHHANVDLDQLIADMFRAVADEHELALHAVVLINEGDISKTSSGKIQRNECKQRYLNGLFKIVHQATFAVAPATPSLASPSLLTRFYDLDSEECRTQVEAFLTRTVRLVRPALFHIDVHRSLVSEGLDSLAVAALGNAIESSVGVAIPHATLMERSIRQLADDIIQQLCAKERATDEAASTSIDAMSDAEVSSLLDEMLAAKGQRDD